MNDDRSMPRRSSRSFACSPLLNVMNFVDRQLLASFANFIVPDLGLTNTQFGLLTGFAFIIFYATMGLFMGALADRVHRPRLIAAGLALWSALTAASGAARGFADAGAAAHVHRRRRVGAHADLDVAAVRSVPAEPSRVRLGLLLHGRADRSRRQPAHRRLPGPAIGWRGCFYVLGAIGAGARPWSCSSSRRHRDAMSSRRAGGQGPRGGAAARGAGAPGRAPWCRRCAPRRRSRSPSPAASPCTSCSAPRRSTSSGTCRSAASSAPRSRG